jgi:hypothetical protein
MPPTHIDLGRDQQPELNGCEHHQAGALWERQLTELHPRRSASRRAGHQLALLPSSV